MRRPAPLVLLILLLVAAANLVSQPLIEIILIGVLCALFLLILHRLVVHGFPNRLRVSPRGGRIALWSLVAVAAIAPFCAMLATQPMLRLTATPAQFTTTDGITDQRGFYATETDAMGNRYVWTRDHATLVFDSLVHKPVTLTVAMRSAAITGGPDAPVRVTVNGRDIGELHPDPTSRAFQPLSVRFVPFDWGGGRTEIKFTAQPFVPSSVDTRQLGTMIQSVSLDKGEAWSTITRRLWLIGALPALAALMIGCALVARRSRSTLASRAASALCIVGAADAALVTALILRIGVIQWDTYVAWTLGSLAIAICFTLAALTLPFGAPDAPNLLRRARSWIGRYRPGARFAGWRDGALRPLSCPSAVEPMPTRRAIVSDLLLVFVVALGVRCIWAVIVPPWQGPDEPDHYVYAAHIANQGRIPHVPFPPYPAYPIEVGRSWGLTLFGDVSRLGNAGPPNLAYLPIAYDYAAARSYTAPFQERLSDAGARRTGDPPLYFLLEAVPYLLFKNAPILSRLFALRVGSGVLGALSCVFAYLLAYELRRQRSWGWAIGLCMALMPMYAFIAGTVNNDVGVDLFAGALTWLIARAWRRPTLSLPLALAIGVTSGLALLTKATALPIILIAGIIVLIKAFPLLRASRRALRARAAVLGTYAGGVIAMYAPWLLFWYRYYNEIRILTIPIAPFVRFLSGATTVAASPTRGPEMAIHGPSIVTFLATHTSLLDYLRYETDSSWVRVQNVLLKTFWGDFGWLDAPLPDHVFTPIVVAYLIGGVGLLIQFALQPKRRGMLLLLVGMIVAQVVFLFIGVDWYQSFRHEGIEFGLQGRYFFPVLAPLLLLLLSGWEHLAGERGIILRLAPFCMAVLQLIALATILSRYYGVEVG